MPKEKKRSIDRCLSDMILLATGLVGELRYVTMVEWFDELEKGTWWGGKKLPNGAGATLFLEIAKARAQWKASPTPPFDHSKHGETAIMMDVFQMKLGELARDVKYEIYKRDPYGNVHLIEQGGIEHFAARGLLVDLEVGQNIVTSELVEDVHRLTIGAMPSQDETMDHEPKSAVHESSVEGFGKMDMGDCSEEEDDKTGMGEFSEEGDAAMDCTSD